MAGMIEKLLTDLNHLSGLFLVLIAFSISSCAASLHTIKRDLECLHEDYDRVSHAHDILEDERRAQRPDSHGF
jgi:hypothetical protein